MSKQVDVIVSAFIECINEEIRRAARETEEINKEQRHRKIALKKIITNEYYSMGLSKAKSILIDISGYEPRTARGKNE